MHLWRYPSLSIHGIEGAFDEPGAKTVIPGRVTGKFSIRLVPHMNTSVVEKQVTGSLTPCLAAPFLMARDSSGSNSAVGTEIPFLIFPSTKGTRTNVKKIYNFCVVKISFRNYMQLP